MLFHHQSGDDVVRALSTDATRGLTEPQVQELREKFGENKLREKKPKTNFPVSYTHLDVYKRQVYGAGCKGNYNTLVRLARKTVSYTHLARTTSSPD